MAAAATDLLQEVGISTATTLDANYTINDTSITVASTSGWPTATGVTFAIDVVDSAGAQVAGTYNEYVGVVSSATSITSVDHVNGTDRNYSAGATTRVMIVVSAERENRIVEWGLVEHKQTGAHGDITATSLATNTISEGTAGTGVTIDGLLLKDNKLATNDSVVTANITDDAVSDAKLVYGKVRSRLGGSATNWGTAGTTTYDYSGTNTFMQVGTSAYDGVGVDTITFPTAFNQVPIVVATVVTAATANCYARLASISSTTFAVQLFSDSGTTVAETFNWIAIGQ